MIYLLRHGQTEFNAAGRYQGRLDSPLTPRGLAQAQQMGAALAALVEPAGVVIMASPLGRALRTAQIVGASLGRSVTTDPRLIEVGLGEWEGRTAAEIDTGWPGQRDAFPRNEWVFHAPGGESYDSVATRIGDVLTGIAADPERVRVIVTHAFTGRVLRGLFAGLPRHRAVRLEIPQDAVLRLDAGGSIVRIPVAPVS